MPLASTGDEHRDRPNAYFELPQPVKARYVRYVHGHVGAAYLAISDIRIFGTANQAAPSAPGRVVAVRDPDSRDVHIRWAPVEGAIGYNVRWGIRPDRLTLTYQIFAEDDVKAFGGRQHGHALDLRALNTGETYFIAVEAFNESGVSALSPVIKVEVPQP